MMSEIPLKQWVDGEATRLGLLPIAIYRRMSRQKYPGLVLRRVNKRVVFVQIDDGEPADAAARAAREILLCSQSEIQTAAIIRKHMATLHREFLACQLYKKARDSSGIMPWRWDVLNDEVRAKFRAEADATVEAWDARNKQRAAEQEKEYRES